MRDTSAESQAQNSSTLPGWLSERGRGVSLGFLPLGVGQHSGNQERWELAKANIQRKWLQGTFTECL